MDKGVRYYWLDCSAETREARGASPLSPQAMRSDLGYAVMIGYDVIQMSTRDRNGRPLRIIACCDNGAISSVYEVAQ